MQNNERLQAGWQRIKDELQCLPVPRQEERGQGWQATFFVGSILLILFFVGSFSSLLNYTMFFNMIGLILGASSIFILRKKTKHLDDTGIYIMRWFPVLPVVFILAYTYVTISIVMDDPLACLVCLGAFPLGYAIYYLATRAQRSNI